MTPEQEREVFEEWVKMHSDFSHFESYEIANLFDAWQARAAIEAERQARDELVLYQVRTRPVWNGASKNWTAWENCTKDQANDYRRAKVLHDWEYEVRELYTAPQPQQIPEGWQLVPKEPTSKQVCLMAFEVQGVNEKGVCRTDDPRWPESVEKAEAAYKAMLAAAPEPENKT